MPIRSTAIIAYFNRDRPVVVVTRRRCPTGILFAGEKADRAIVTYSVVRARPTVRVCKNSAELMSRDLAGDVVYRNSINIVSSDAVVAMFMCSYRDVW